MIIKSTLVAQSKQADGRFYITEVHLTDTGQEIRVEYLADAKDDHEARMQARALQLDVQAANEAQTKSEQVALASAQAKIDAYVSTLTDQQLKNAVGLSDAEVAAVKMP